MLYKFSTVYSFYCYNRNEKKKLKGLFLRTFQKVLEERLPESIDCTISKLTYLDYDESDNSRIEVELNGQYEDDLIFVFNILKEITGESITSKKVKKGSILTGYLKDVSKMGFGVFLDGGIINPSKDILLPLHELRKQINALIDETSIKKKKPHKYSNNEIIKLLGFQDNLPVEIEISKIIELKRGEYKYNAKLSDKYLDTLKSWIDGRMDIIFTTGAARQAIKKVIAKRGHTEDIFRIERLGPMETAIICNQGTSGPGIIAHIGKYLPNCHFSTLIPSNL